MPVSEFKGRVAVITGGASGIGRAVAEALAREGCRLVLADVEAAALDKAVAELAGGGAKVIGVPTDVSRAEALDALADATWDRFGAAHIVMHNAGVAVFGPTQDMSLNDWQWSIDVNLWGPIHGTRAFTPRMVAQGEGGHHVFTASFAGLVPNRQLGPYNVTKAGVVALAESLRKDLRGTGVGASVLCPMRVTSNIDKSYRNRPEALGGAIAIAYSDEERAELKGRTLTAQEVAGLVLDGIRHDRPYIHTHREAEPLVRARAERILAGFDAAL